jgi:hypothetical protein
LLQAATEVNEQETRLLALPIHLKSSQPHARAEDGHFQANRKLGGFHAADPAQAKEDLRNINRLFSVSANNARMKTVAFSDTLILLSGLFIATAMENKCTQTSS